MSSQNADKSSSPSNTSIEGLYSINKQIFTKSKGYIHQFNKDRFQQQQQATQNPIYKASFRPINSYSIDKDSKDFLPSPNHSWKLQKSDGFEGQQRLSKSLYETTTNNDFFPVDQADNVVFSHISMNYGRRDQSRQKSKVKINKKQSEKSKSAQQIQREANEEDYEQKNSKDSFGWNAQFSELRVEQQSSYQMLINDMSLDYSQRQILSEKGDSQVDWSQVQIGNQFDQSCVQPINLKQQLKQMFKPRKVVSATSAEVNEVIKEFTKFILGIIKLVYSFLPHHGQNITDCSSFVSKLIEQVMSNPFKMLERDAISEKINQIIQFMIEEQISYDQLKERINLAIKAVESLQGRNFMFFIEAVILFTLKTIFEKQSQRNPTLIQSKGLKFFRQFLPLIRQIVFGQSVLSLMDLKTLISQSARDRIFDKQFHYLEISNATIRTLKGWAKAADGFASKAREKQQEKLPFIQLFQMLGMGKEDKK